MPPKSVWIFVPTVATPVISRVGSGIVCIVTLTLGLILGTPLLQLKVALHGLFLVILVVVPVVAVKDIVVVGPSKFLQWGATLLVLR